MKRMLYTGVRAILIWLATSVAIMALGTAGLAAWLVIGSWTYRQHDDLERVARKNEYLTRIRAAGPAASAVRPNVVLILFDDLGFGDLGSYGSRAIQTPRIDALAAGGVRLTQYYSPAPVCSPARAALLTGRYPPRTRVTQVAMTPDAEPGSAADVFRLPLYELQRAAGAATRLPLEEITLAEVLQAAGYATGLFGKWHLGSTSPSLPNERGFDTFHGVHSSNDQEPNPFYHDDSVVERPPIDQTTLTRRYTDGAIAFMQAHRHEPFFVYLPHTFPHRPLHPSADQRGRSNGGLYGDVVEDLDRSVGRVIDSLRDLGLEEQTLVLITSDNGPWFQGSPGLHRGRKTDLFEGGFAVPFIAHWPGTLPAGAVRDTMSMGIDVFPTVLALAGLALPDDRAIDGRDILPMLRDGAPSPHDTLAFYWTSVLGAVRDVRFKYQRRRPVRVGYGLAPITVQLPMGPWLFDLQIDGDESYDVSTRHPHVFERLARDLERRVEADRNDPRGFR